MPNTVTVNFPIDQNEQAKQLKADHLLPQDVYLTIASLIEGNLAKLKKMKNDSEMLDDIDDCRAHETILIDGGRGVGKSSVLVNLEMFLKDLGCNKSGLKAEDLLILKPVDPTLVENGDSLLLNIIVAALMRNKEVRRKLDNSDYRSDAFYEQLQKLGCALEAVETRDVKHGIDKLRSFMGGHGLAQEIHKLFKATLELTGKKLIICKRQGNHTFI
ncbi:hypothetical protein [Psychromonas hadalis]|uniref:hypothetical protein n=1 Tax=Psychromonas hadalis TaxID=211669 RepID=UPI0003B69F8D|nr:hypothetical protein [Psychromonas hadalis]